MHVHHCPADYSAALELDRTTCEYLADLILTSHLSLVHETQVVSD